MYKKFPLREFFMIISRSKPFRLTVNSGVELKMSVFSLLRNDMLTGVVSEDRNPLFAELFDLLIIMDLGP